MTTPPTMKAWLYNTTSASLPKTLHFSPHARVPPSPLSPNKILISVLSSSLNPADIKVPSLGLISRAIITLPASIGMDYSGHIISIGSNLKLKNTELEVGDLVFGRLDRPSQFGSTGDFIQVERDGCLKIPKGVGIDDAAGIECAGVTAWASIVPFMSGVEEGSGDGKKVFINGGSGGTGTFGIQIAKILGWHVTTSCSEANIELCINLGADEVLDYRKVDVGSVLSERAKEEGELYDLVIDNVGTPSDLYAKANRFLKKEGVFVQVGVLLTWGGVKDILTRLLWPTILGGGDRKFVMVDAKHDIKAYKQMAKWVQQGKLKVIIDEVFEFEDLVKAVEKLKTGRARGKIIVHVGKKEVVN